VKPPEALYKGKQPDRVTGGVAAEEQVSGLSVLSAVSVTALLRCDDPEIHGRRAKE
jgi:hypothetical protein